VSDHRQEIATAIWVLVDDFGDDRWSGLIHVVQRGITIGHLFGAFVELELLEVELTPAIVRAVWAVREECTADVPRCDHLLRPLYDLVIEKYDE